MVEHPGWVCVRTEETPSDGDEFDWMKGGAIASWGNEDMTTPGKGWRLEVQIGKKGERETEVPEPRLVSFLFERRPTFLDESDVWTERSPANASSVTATSLIPPFTPRLEKRPAPTPAARHARLQSQVPCATSQVAKSGIVLMLMHTYARTGEMGRCESPL
jgi:hypothetical protein